MSLFGAASGFGTGGASMFGSAAADNHNPMKVPPKASWVCRDTAGGPTLVTVRETQMAWEPPLAVKTLKFCPGCFLKYWSRETVCPLDECPIPPDIPDHWNHSRCLLKLHVPRAQPTTVDSEFLWRREAGDAVIEHFGARVTGWAIVWEIWLWACLWGCCL